MPKGRLLDPSRSAKVKLRKSKKQEERTATQVGGRVVPGSGNQWHSKSDVSSDKWLIENKRTDKKSYALKVEELALAKVRAAREGKKPMMQVDLGNTSVVIVLLSDAEAEGWL